MAEPLKVLAGTVGVGLWLSAAVLTAVFLEDLAVDFFAVGFLLADFLTAEALTATRGLCALVMDSAFGAASAGFTAVLGLPNLSPTTGNAVPQTNISSAKSEGNRFILFPIDSGFQQGSGLVYLKCDVKLTAHHF